MNSSSLGYAVTGANGLEWGNGNLCIESVDKCGLRRWHLCNGGIHKSEDNVTILPLTKLSPAMNRLIHSGSGQVSCG